MTVDLADLLQRADLPPVSARGRGGGQHYMHRRFGVVSQPQHPRRAALTLIETVVAIGLLSSASALVVPTLSKAREDAKRLTCLNRLGQINRALLSYHADLDELPLFVLTDSDGDSLGWTSWSYGGWSGRNREFWEDYYGAGAFNIQTAERPLSVYMTAWKIPEQIDPLTPTQEMPVFQCPSDNISAQWQWADNDYVAGLSAYDDVGTSYALNYTWWDQVQKIDVPPGEDAWAYYVNVYGAQIFEKYMARDTAVGAGGERPISWNVASSTSPRASKRNSDELPDYEPSRFITLMEDPAYYGLAVGLGIGGAGIQMPGYHGEFSTHVVAFSDGGVDYIYMDTRHLHDSPPNPPGPRHDRFAPIGNWTACDQSKEHEDGGRHYN